MHLKRIARNRTRSGVLLAVLVLTLAPFVVGTGYLATAVGYYLFHRGTARLSRSVDEETRYLHRLDSSGSEAAGRYRQDLDDRRTVLEERRREDHAAILEYTPVSIAVLMVLLGLLVWATASPSGGSASSRLLAQIGALPPAGEQLATAELIDDLASRAGVRPPKLYIIPCGIPVSLCGLMGGGETMLALSRGLISLLDRPQLEALMAHELSHIVNRDLELKETLGTVSLFMTAPFRFLRSHLNFEFTNRFQFQIRIALIMLAITPIGLYIFLVGPAVGFLVRRWLSRGQEYAADHDACVLTGNPDALVSALAKIMAAGAGIKHMHPQFACSCAADPQSLGQTFEGRFLADRPRHAKRIQMLVQTLRMASVNGLEQAIQTGKEYAREHPDMVDATTELTGEGQLLAGLQQGDPMGSVYRLLSSKPVSIYERPNTRSYVTAKLNPGELLVAFDNPGEMRQVNTAGEGFGYMTRSIKLERITGVLPQEIYDPASRAKVEKTLAPIPAPAPETEDAQALPKLLAITAGLGIAIVVSVSLVVWAFGGN